MIERGADRREQACAPCVDRVEGAGTDQRLDGAAIDAALVDASAEIEQVGERALGSRGDDRLDRGPAGALDPAEAVADVLAIDRLEAVIRRVDVRRHYRQAEPGRVVVELAQLVGVVHHRRQVGGHERRRMMRLEVRRLVGDQRVRGRVRLVEAVTGELFHQVEKLRRLGRGQASVDRAGREALTMLGHFVGQLLAHRAAQQVGSAQRIAADDLRDLHHLLLIDHYAVRRRQDRLEARVDVLEALGALLAPHIVGNELHRPRTIEGDQGDHVVEALRRRLQQELAHAARFELEHRRRIAAAENVVSARVVQRQRVERQRRRGIEHADVTQRPVEDRQRRQPEEVELDQADELDVILVELGDQRVGARLRVQRAEIGQLARSDQHATGMHADVARQALELLGEAQKLAHFFFGRLALVEQRLDLARINDVRRRVAAAPLERHRAARLERNQLGDAVAEAVREVQDAADVAHHRLGRHRAEGRDLRYRLGAVLLLDVIDDTVAAVLAEIDVEVRHRHALRIQEALEQQRIPQRVQIGDAEAVGDQRAGAGAASRPDRHAVAPRPVDEVGDDQEVAGIPHLNDRLRLELEPGRILGLLARPLFRIGIQGGEPPFEPRGCLVAQMLLDTGSVWRRERRQIVLAQRNRQVAALRDRDAVGERLRHVGEQLRHLGLRLEILLGREAASAAADRRARGPRRCIRAPRGRGIRRAL